MKNIHKPFGFIFAMELIIYCKFTKSGCFIRFIIDQIYFFFDKIDGLCDISN